MILISNKRYFGVANGGQKVSGWLTNEESKNNRQLVNNKARSALVYSRRLIDRVFGGFAANQPATAGSARICTARDIRLGKTGSQHVSVGKRPIATRNRWRTRRKKSCRLPPARSSLWAATPAARATWRASICRSLSPKTPIPGATTGSTPDSSTSSLTMVRISLNYVWPAATTQWKWIYLFKNRFWNETNFFEMYF